MARTLDEIYNSITTAFVANTVLRTFYGINDSKTFAEHFSAVSLEAQILYIVANAIFTLEDVFARFQTSIETALANLKPHTPRWYRLKAMAFQKDYTLASDSDVYDSVDESAKVVKYAAAVEPPDASKLLIKIAGGESGSRDKLPDEVATQVRAYLQTIKDAGVRIELVNQSPDSFRCEVDIYYNAMLLADDVRAAVRRAIVNYIETLEFNGEYSNMALVDAIQVVPGVVVVELLSSSSRAANSDISHSQIDAKRVPDAGYFRAYDESDITINMRAYELV